MTKGNGKRKDVGSATVSVRELQILLGSDQISLNALYRAVAKGDVPSIRIGRRLLISRDWANAQLSGRTASK